MSDTTDSELKPRVLKVLEVAARYLPPAAPDGVMSAAQITGTLDWPELGDSPDENPVSFLARLEWAAMEFREQVEWVLKELVQAGEVDSEQVDGRVVYAQVVKF